MDGGTVTEFDAVLSLFDQQDSIFRSLCDKAGLSKQDILQIQQESLADVEGAAGLSSR
jgi:ATP-binding cassette subfamily C (CFTR/MRP) protein 1